MENPARYTNYKDFFPFYLREHSKKSTRMLHYFGTIGYQVLFWSLLLTQNYLFLPLILLAGYGPAWIGHFFIEKNKPATFKYPCLLYTSVSITLRQEAPYGFFHKLLCCYCFLGQRIMF